MQEEIMAGLEKKSRAELDQLSPTHVGQLRPHTGTASFLFDKKQSWKYRPVYRSHAGKQPHHRLSAVAEVSGLVVFQFL